MTKLIMVVFFICCISIAIIGVHHGTSLSKEYTQLTKEVTQLRMLKAHFYDFRERIYMTVPVDYLSKVTIDDFDFDKYLEDEQ